MDARQIKQMVANALGSVRQALRGKLQRATSATHVILVQTEGLAGESFNDAELFQQPGLRSVPLPGMQTIVIPLGGRSANGVVVAMSNGALFITDLQPGEVAVFNENDGVASSIILRNGKVIDITCDTLNITAGVAVNITVPNLTLTTTTTAIAASTVAITADMTEIDGAAHVLGTLSADVDLVAAGKSLKAHVHDQVATGSALSGTNQ
jgi:phage baseplate assembly protein V